MTKTPQEQSLISAQQEVLQQALAELQALKQSHNESSKTIVSGIAALQGSIRTLIAKGTAEQHVEAFKESSRKIASMMAALAEETRTIIAIGLGIVEVEAFDWEKQYAEAIKTLGIFYLDGDNLPRVEAVQAAFSSGEEEAIKSLQEAVLLLVPVYPRHDNQDVSFAVNVQALDRSRLAYNKTYVNEGVFGPVGKDSGKKPIGYQPVVIDGKQQMDSASYDDRNKRLSERIVVVRKNRKPHMSGPDRNQYALLQMHALSNGNPVDQGTWTPLDGDNAQEGNTVPSGGWFDNKVDFGGVRADGVFDGARFRSSVSGDVLQA